MEGSDASGDGGGNNLLTDKQKHVLDLLLENKTSKEIARTLGISPYTVDQRIALARGKLGVSSRSELAARYRSMRQAQPMLPPHTNTDPAVDQEAALSSHLMPEVVRHPVQPLTQMGANQLAITQLSPAVSAVDGNFCPTGPEFDTRVGPRVFEGSFGALWRVGAIVATALLLVMTILGLFAIFAQLNELLA